MARLRREHLILLLVAALAVAVIAALFVYKDRGGTPAPTPAAVTTPTPQPSASSTASVASSVDGTWHVGAGSTVGYRVRVTAFGLSTTVKSRTPKVWGAVTVAGGSVARCSLVVDMTAYSGTQRERSAIGAQTFPTARFVLTRSVPLSSSDPSAGAASYPASGRLILRGRSLPLELTLSCVHAASSFTVRARVPIAFARWHVTVPAGFACRGDVEIVLQLVRGAGNAPTVTTS